MSEGLSKPKRELFIQKDVVTIAGALETFGVTLDLSTVYQGRILPSNTFSADSSLCLATLIKNPNKFMYTSERVDTMEQLISEYDLDLSRSEMYENDGERVKNFDRARKPAEQVLHKRYPTRGNVLSLGYTSGKQLIFIDNMGIFDTGLTIIEDSFSGDKLKINKYFTDFKNEYRLREQEVVSSAVTDIDRFKDDRQGTKKSSVTETEVEPRIQKYEDDGIEFYRKRALVNTETPSFTHAKEYLDDVLGKIEEHENGDHVDLEAIVAEIKQKDPDLMPGAVEYYYQNALKLIKKSFKSNKGVSDEIVYLRFNKLN